MAKVHLCFTTCCDVSRVCGRNGNEVRSEEDAKVLLLENEVSRIQQELARSTEELEQLRRHMDSQVICGAGACLRMIFADFPTF